ncbi:MAG: creatininase family protein [Deltaproteobacteria bacterium]|nr:creatininase family protein [Deltaproteobacteria bacterium]
MLLAPLPFPRASLVGKWAILPTGACEAHGPHLPLDTDVRIATAMAEAAAERADGRVLPPVTYGVARFARNFPGTITVSAEVMTALVAEVLVSAHEAGAAGLAIANGHLEPENVNALFAACRLVKERTGASVAFPHVGSKRQAERLSAIVPFDGHAGVYETSLLLALAPRLVRGHKKLPAVEADLGRGIAQGADNFEDAGGPRAYFGQPALATAHAGRRLLRELASILVETMENSRR